jgi:hypothetical protein
MFTAKHSNRMLGRQAPKLHFMRARLLLGG